MKTIIIRYMLSLLLIYGIYTETGWCTALFSFLMFSYVEAMDYLNRSNKKTSDSNNKKLTDWMKSFSGVK